MLCMYKQLSEIEHCVTGVIAKSCTDKHWLTTAINVYLLYSNHIFGIHTQLMEMSWSVIGGTVSDS